MHVFFKEYARPCVSLRITKLMSSDDQPVNICEKVIEKSVPIYNKKTKLSGKKAFELETLALTRIKNCFKCYCSDKIPDGKYRSHFPTIVRTSATDKTICLSHCGNSLNHKTTKDKVKDKYKDDPLFIQAQITCIMMNLEEAKVKHVDCPINGQNICWDDVSSSLSLIDFNACAIDDIYQSGPLKRWRGQYGYDNNQYTRLFAAQLALCCSK
jgi:hypothetical protein